MITSISHQHFVGLQRTAPSKTAIVHAFDLDDTLTLKPVGFDNTGMTKDQFFDASRDFGPDVAVSDLARMLYNWGDHIAICTARPPDRLTESWQWLIKHGIPFNSLMTSTGERCSGIAKQHMLKYLRRQYRMVGTLFDDSPYNIQGAKLQRISTIHLRKNDEYWETHPERIHKV